MNRVGWGGFIRSGLLCLILGWGSSSLALAQAQVDLELQQLQRAIKESRKKVEIYEREHRELLEVVEELDRDLENLRGAAEESSRNLRKAEAVGANAETSLADVKAKLAQIRRAMARRAVALYKAGEAGPLQLLFSSSDLREVLSKIWSLEHLLESSQELIHRFDHERLLLESLSREAETAREASDSASRRLEARTRLLAMERNERRKVIERVRSDRAKERLLGIELERAARALQEKLTRLGKAPSEGGGPALDASAFERLRGRLRRPVAGPVRRPFGREVDTDYLTETFHKGVIFAAKHGEHVKTGARGKVRFAGWFRGYGKIVILDHGGGYFTVFGHLAQLRVKVGEMVDGGAVVGTVGETGSLDGPGLYFEVRRAGRPLDPANWLATG